MSDASLASGGLEIENLFVESRSFRHVERGLGDKVANSWIGA